MNDTINLEPKSKAFDPSRLPDDFRTSSRYVNWKLETHEGRENCKVPYSPVTKQRASSTDPATQGTLDQAIAADLEHVGLVIGPPFVAVDGDKCRNPETGEVDQWFTDLLAALPPTYTEYSPSGKGFHLWFKAKQPKGVADGVRSADLEVYFSKRYFTLTTDQVPGTPRELATLTDEQLRELLSVVESRRKKNEPKRKPGRPPSIDKLKLLMAGEFELAGFGDVSAAVQSLLVLLALKHELDREKIEADFKLSGLYRDFRPLGRQSNWIEKWDRLRDGELTKAIDQARELLEKQRPPADAIVIGSGQPGNEAIFASEKILTSKPELLYFKRSGDLVRPVLHNKTDTDDQEVKRDRLAVTIQPISSLAIIRDLDAEAKYVTSTGNGKWRPALPSEALANHLRDRVRQGQAAYRELDSVVSSPTLLASGELLQQPCGFREGVFYILPNAKFSPVPENPTQEEARAALNQFAPIYHGFPFVGEKGQPWDETPAYAAVLAATLSLAARPAIPTVPLFGVTCPSYGGGKTKIAEAIGMSVVGHRPTVCDYVNDEEFAKTLVPLVRAGDRAVLIDNVSISLRGDRFAAVLTSQEHSARILGQSENVLLLNRTVFFATGVNLALEGDLAARRSLLISIDPDCERPEERDFDFDPVTRARESYPELVVAALTALRAYVVAGKPKVLNRPLLGSFEVWDELVCGCLVWCGFADPCLTRKKAIAQDPQREADLELLRTWHTVYGSEPVSLSKVKKDARAVFPLLCVRDAWDPRAVSWRLRKITGKVVGGYKLTTDTSYDSAHYVVTSQHARAEAAHEQDLF